MPVDNAAARSERSAYGDRVEMTLTVHVPRRLPRPVDVVVRWSGEHSASDLCVALAGHLGEPVPRLSSRGRPVEADTRVGMPPLVHGATLAVAVSAPPARPLAPSPWPPLVARAVHPVYVDEVTIAQLDALTALMELVARDKASPEGLRVSVGQPPGRR